MHELSLLIGVVGAVNQAVANVGGGGVEAVGLRVGSHSGAVPEALLAAWPLAIAGTTAEGARLDLEVVAAAVWCGECARDVEIDETFALLCPVCGTPTGHLSRGREFALAWVDVV